MLEEEEVVGGAGWKLGRQDGASERRKQMENVQHQTLEYNEHTGF